MLLVLQDASRKVLLLAAKLHAKPCHLNAWQSLACSPRDIAVTPPSE